MFIIATSAGVCKNLSAMGSSLFVPCGFEGKLHGSIGTLPPSILATVMLNPAFCNAENGCVISGNQYVMNSWDDKHIFGWYIFGLQ